jgi:ABC-type phosphate transport system auxiliary subunit
MMKNIGDSSGSNNPLSRMAEVGGKLYKSKGVPKIAVSDDRMSVDEKGNAYAADLLKKLGTNSASGADIIATASGLDEHLKKKEINISNTK